MAAIPCEHTSTADLVALTITHTCAKVQKRDTTLLQVFQMTDKAEKILEDAEHLTRQVASEILVFMLSDVNREYKTREATCDTDCVWIEGVQFLMLRRCEI